MSYKGSEGLNGNILDLNPTEIEILNQLVSYRKSGVFKNLVVLISSSHAIQFSELSKYEDDMHAFLRINKMRRVLKVSFGNVWITREERG